MNEIATFVSKTVELFLQDGSSENATLIEKLVGDGVDPALAEELVLFVPTAFARRLMKNMGVDCAPNYVLIGSSPKETQTIPLVDEVVYREAYSLADRWLSESQTGEGYLAIASRSGGFKAINEALWKGDRLEDLELLEPVVRLTKRRTLRKKDAKNWWFTPIRWLFGR